MDDLLGASAALPGLRLAPGEALVREGESGGGLWILASGALQIRKGGVLINTVAPPGAVTGEVSVLPNTACSATVEAAEPSGVRHAADGHALPASDPAITRRGAIGWMPSPDLGWTGAGPPAHPLRPLS
jgi:hypothetical protein